MKYPKIETLLRRDEQTHKVVQGELRCPEFELVNNWHVTEKIDGTNVRVRLSMTCLNCAGGWEPSIAGQRVGTCGECGGSGVKSRVTFGGRTDDAQMPTFLLEHLQRTFTTGRMVDAFIDPEAEDLTSWQVILYGEGYGPRIQKGGGNYRTDGVSFRLFDVAVIDAERTWWLEWENVEDVARKLGVETVPVLTNWAPLDLAVMHVRQLSKVAAEENGTAGTEVEGIVARTRPLLFDRRGGRVMWKLKGKDFA